MVAMSIVFIVSWDRVKTKNCFSHIVICSALLFGFIIVLRLQPSNIAESLPKFQYFTKEIF